MAVRHLCDDLIVTKMDLNVPEPPAEAPAAGEEVPPPVFKLKRPGKQRSDCWKVIKMLDDEDPRIHLHKPHHTHYCNICAVTMSLTWVGNRGKATGNYVTTQADQHLATAHPDEVQVVNSIIKSKAKKSVKSEMIKSNLSKVLASSSPLDQGEKEEFKQSLQACHPGGTLHYASKLIGLYIPRKVPLSAPPLSSFCDPSFIDMLSAVVPDHCNITGSIPILSERKLKFYIDAEYNLLKQEMTSLITEKSQQSQGNVFAQLIHDAATLKNATTVQSIGLQLVDKWFRSNHVLCLCCRESSNNLHLDIANLCRSVTLEMVGMDLSDICGIAVQDRAALKVPEYLGFDEAEACDMHDGDKIGRSAIG